MTESDGLPWFHVAAGLLDLHRQDRVLMLGAGQPSHVRAIAALVGARGDVTVVEADRVLAEAIAELELPQVEVLALVPTGEEKFGAFDAMLCAPTGMPRWPLALFARLPLANLRPGGRLALDLPGPDMVPDVTAVAAEIGAAEAELAPLHGPADDVIAALLREAGLRRVQTLLGTHLLQLASPFDLADLAGDALGLLPERRLELGRALARRLHSTGACEALVHRTRVQAIR